MFPLSAFWSSPAMAMTLAILDVVLAGIVTIDVLLKKSDVRGALGWIGAVWFAPILGSLLYYLFGINRVTRRALKLNRLHEKQATPPEAVTPRAAAHIALLSQVSARVTQNPLTGGNAFAVLEGGDKAYPEMLAAIRAAKHCIAMSSYIFRDDAAGQEFAQALIEAVKRGVAVRVLLDSVGAGYIHPEIFYRMQRGGVKAARFLHTWLPWRMPFLNMRNHRKILVADGALAFMGGLNIGAENSARLSGARQIRDVHFRVEGPVVRVVMDAFARDWTFTTDETLDGDCWWPDLKPVGEACARGLRSGPDADIYRLELILGAALNLAQSHVRIITPYFLPDPRLQFAIQQAGLRGVKVEIVLPGQSNQWIMQWAMRGHLRFFRYIRATVITTPPPFDHTKLCTVDGEWSLIGSSNWDARSFRLNFEFDLEVTDRKLTAELDALIDARIATGTVLTADMLAAEPLWKRLRNAAARLWMPYL
ncbi:MAG TPA: phospholipase D-like domain-containing protein [Rhizomicrobium sp.]|jgi:cardiolipin synthase|nr:phospholipase D-like domain-containing protein [Rhizomicrobium sp.]